MTTAAPAAHRDYAGLVTRLLGLTVDVGLLTVAGLAVSSLPGLAWQQVLGEPPGWLTGAAGIVATLLPWLYFTATWTLTGRTAGALLVGVRTVRTDGRGLSVWRSAARALVGLLFAPVWLVGLVGTLTDGRRRAWHDRLFGTVVRRG
ncbi:MAG TPA: RDD family protein [Micromonosporaceae bacterium]